ncbi:MAG: SpoIIIAH-like family protein [Clostridia bacterium]|nr:SpoIIIAH-like family protein [Clostridia bacterium]
MKFRKRQLVLTALVATLGAAVYLNWQFADNKNLNSTNVLESSHELGEARYVNSSKVSETEENENSDKLSKESKKYFAQAKSDRQKVRDELDEKLKNLLNESNQNPESKKIIEESINSFVKNSQQETNIENLIKAKGFGDCVVSIQNGECSVIVNSGTLNENSVIIIRDIVSGQAGIPFEKIKITEVK